MPPPPPQFHAGIVHYNKFIVINIHAYLNYPVSLPLGGGGLCDNGSPEQSLGTALRQPPIIEQPHWVLGCPAPRGGPPQHLWVRGEAQPWGAPEDIGGGGCGTQVTLGSSGMDWETLGRTGRHWGALGCTRIHWGAHGRQNKLGDAGKDWETPVAVPPAPKGLVPPGWQWAERREDSDVALPHPNRRR